MLSVLPDGVVNVELANLSVALTFNVQHVFGSNCTGGGLWHSELVLAEWCARVIRGQLTSSAPVHIPRVLELGCGACPVAGIAALSLGCDVLFTDLKSLLPSVEANIRLNGPAVVAAREQAAGGFSGSSSASDTLDIPGDRAYRAALSRQCCDTEELMFGEKLPRHAVSMAPFDLVLCSDCVFRKELHVPLAMTLRSILNLRANSQSATNYECVKNDGHYNSPVSQKGCRCLIVFMLRDKAVDMAFVENVCPQFQLTATPFDGIHDLIGNAPWNHDSGAAQCLERNCLVYEVTTA